jgi:hypothetical protein
MLNILLLFFLSIDPLFHKDFYLTKVFFSKHVNEFYNKSEAFNKESGNFTDDQGGFAEESGVLAEKSGELTSKLPSDDDQTENNNKKDVTFLVQPGVYELYDTETGFSYYGESTTLMPRLNFHREQLAKGSHENTALREVFQKNPKLERIQFKVLHAGPEWIDEKKRKACENAYIKNNAHRCFNYIEGHSEAQERTIYPVMAYGVRYTGVRPAAKALKMGRSNIRRICQGGKNPNIYYVKEEKTRYGEIPIFAQKDNSPSVFFPSYKSCIAAGFAKNNAQILARIRKAEPGWRYAHVDDKGEALRIPYTLKPGEVSYVEWIKTIEQS